MESVSLAQLLEIQSEQTDIVEVLGYIQVALDDGHRVESSKREEVYLKTGRGLVRLRIPVVTFHAKVLEGSLDE